MSAHAEQSRTSGLTLVTSLLGALVVGAGLFAWFGIASLPFFGWDAYPLIASARVAGVGDAFALLGRELMDGRYPLGDFYRPLVQLSFALDHAVWGIEAFGYHVTDLLLWAAGALATFCLARTLFGARALAAATFAGLFFALHPLGWDVLPAPARRADLMAVLFTTAALACVPRTDGTASARSWLAAAFALLACGSKESGVLVAPLLVVFFAFARPSGSVAVRVRSGVRFAVPALAATLVYLVARQVVIGGLGGGSRASLLGGFLELHEVMARAASALFPPFGTDWTAHHADLGTVLAVVGLIGAAVALSRTKRETSLAERRPLSGLLVWAALLIYLTGVSGDRRAWYALPFLPITALLVGYVAEHGLAFQRRGAKLGGAALVGLAALVLAYPARSGGLVRPTPDSLALGARAITDFFARFDTQVGFSRAGETVVLEALRPELVYTANEREKRLALHTDYSVRAYAELRYPGAKLRVERGNGPAPAPAQPDERVIVLELTSPK
ncbi:MAG: hypothetical protein L6Q99_21885 [Planctomycetes bacterium]|nr:hypothetical protein [Planctomycetota bacterium]